MPANFLITCLPSMARRSATQYTGRDFPSRRSPGRSNASAPSGSPLRFRAPLCRPIPNASMPTVLCARRPWLGDAHYSLLYPPRQPPDHQKTKLIRSRAGCLLTQQHSLLAIFFHHRARAPAGWQPNVDVKNGGVARTGCDVSWQIQ